MFEKLRTALGAPGAAMTHAASPAPPASQPPPLPATTVHQPAGVVVPLVRARTAEQQEGTQFGYLGRQHNGGPPSALQTWGPPLRLADQDVRAAWGQVAGHVRHLVQNSGWLAGAVDQCVAYSVGAGLEPQVEPEADLLGWEVAFARTWARQVEKLFRDWCNDPLSADDRGQMTFGQMQAAALRGWFSTGDVIGVSTYRERPGSRYRSGFTVIDPVRVATPPMWNGQGQSTAFHGIELDAHGRPVAFWLKPLPGGDPKGTRIATFGSNGRQLVVHSFIGEPGQVRGVSPFAPVVQAMGQTQALSDAMVLAAHAAASVIGTVTSDLPSDTVARSLGGDGGDPVAALMAQRMTWHQTLAKEKADVTLGPNAKVFHLSTGERFEMYAARQHYEHFPDHLKALLREISRASGLPYEMLSLDRSNATYSSGRLGLVDFWSIVEMRRASLLEPMSNVALQNFTEEAIDRKLVPYPGGLQAFRAQKTLALKSRWFGPPKPSADELKSVRSAVERLKWGITSLSEEAAAYGADWEATLRQRAAEQELSKELGLEVPTPVPTKSIRVQEGKP